MESPNRHDDEESPLLHGSGTNRSRRYLNPQININNSQPEHTPKCYEKKSSILVSNSKKTQNDIDNLENQSNCQKLISFCFFCFQKKTVFLKI